MMILRKYPVLVPAGIAVLSLIIVAPSVSRTILLTMQYLSLEKQVASIENITRSAPETAGIQLLMEEGTDPAKIVFDVLSMSSQENKVLIRKAEPPKTSVSNDIEIHTQQIVLEGEFVALIKTLDDIRDALRTIRISSLKFQTEAERNKPGKLQVYVTFQYAKPVEYESN